MRLQSSSKSGRIESELWVGGEVKGEVRVKGCRGQCKQVVTIRQVRTCIRLGLLLGRQESSREVRSRSSI